MTAFMYNAQYLRGGSHLGYLRNHLDIRDQPFDHSTKVKVVQPPPETTTPPVAATTQQQQSNNRGRKRKRQSTTAPTVNVHANNNKKKEKPVYVYCRMILPMPKGVWEQIFGWLMSNTSLARSKRKNGNNSNNEEVTEQEQQDITVPSMLLDDEGDDGVDIAGIEGGFDPEAENKPTISISTLQMYKSAVIWFHAKLRVAFKCSEEIEGTANAAAESLDAHLNEIINGYKRVVACKKSSGIMSVTEGKSVISDVGYIALMKALSKLGSEKPNGIAKEDFQTAVFSASWLSLQWNLISRGVSIEDIHLEHLQWSGDCLRVTFAKSKGDQTGEGLGNVKHVYANPLRPEVCCILAMAIYFFSVDREQNSGDTKLFQGKGQKSRWADVLGRAVNSLSDDVDLGCHKSEGKYRPHTS